MKKLVVIALALTACTKGRSPASGGGPDLTHVDYLEQGWDYAARQQFYFTPQGSHLMPYDVAKAMENATDRELFLTSENLARFGYIPQAATAENPDALPIGFTRDIQKKRAYLGMNCAACHTGQVSYRGQEVRIDGGASLSDFQKFVNAMDEAIYAAAGDDEKFDRFAARMLGASATDGKERLRADLYELVETRKRWHAINDTKMAYGHGRNDAFGIIFNQVLANDLHDRVGGSSILENAREPNAPVSYPVLWDAPHHNIVQWIGIARNNLEEKGPLSRNIGQVLGVFGHVDVDAETWLLHGYCSSAKRTNLEKLEAGVKQLWSPQWPEKILGAIDRAKAARGEKLYKETCTKCHEPINRLDEKRIVHATMVPQSVVGTDPKVCLNASQRTAKSGQLVGKKLSVLEGRKMEDVEPATVVLRHAVAGALIGSISFLTCDGEIETSPGTIIRGWRNVVKTAAGKLFTKEELEQAGTIEQRLGTNGDIFNRYKARPHNGIWASAPYLHNGSVKSLAEMLTPPEKRSRKFGVGCTEFDPVNVGFACDNSRDVFDTSIPGNSNQGHPFGTQLSGAEKGDLLEYLKTL